MSNLRNSYKKLTQPINQGVYGIEDELLSLGRLYGVGVVDQALADAGVIDLAFTVGSTNVIQGLIEIFSTSEIGRAHV